MDIAGDKVTNSVSGTTAESKDTDKTSVKLITAWYAKGEDGGLFTALQEGYYADSGIDMTIEPGGPQVSSMQVVASGQAEFGISYADNILQAREKGIPVVGLMTTYQNVPQVLLSHEENAVTSFEELNNRTVQISPGVLYWQYIKSKYDLKDVTEMNYSGQIANFLNDPMAVNQGYITNEPYTLAQEGVKTSYLRVADSGYANYGNVLFTTEDYLKKHPDVVAAVVAASQKGWTSYLDGDNHIRVNELIKTYNPDGDLETFHNEAIVGKDLILTGDALTGGIGIMTMDRWEQLQDQLLSIGALTKEQDLTKAFTMEFLPKS